MVRDANTAKRDFESLGFRVEKWSHFPDGWDNGGMLFGDRTYLELLWSRDAKLTDKTPEGQLLKKAEHVDSFGMTTSDLGWTVNWLKAAKVKTEVDGYREKPDQPYRWRYGVPEGLAGSPFFIEYGKSASAAKPTLAQPNTVDNLTAVWVVVRDLAASARKYEDAGFQVEQGTQDVPGIAVRAQRVKAGNGWIVLAEPTGEGPFRSHLNKVGVGVAGLTLQCADLDVCKKVAKASRPFSSPWWNGLELPLDKTHGVWVTVSGKA